MGFVGAVGEALGFVHGAFVPSSAAGMPPSVASTAVAAASALGGQELLDGDGSGDQQGDFGYDQRLLGYEGDDGDLQGEDGGQFRRYKHSYVAHHAFLVLLLTTCNNTKRIIILKLLSCWLLTYFLQRCRPPGPTWTKRFGCCWSRGCWTPCRGRCR